MEMLPHLLNLLSDKYADEKDLQTEVAWLLANISAGTSQDTQILVEMNIIPVMAHALRETVNDDLHENVTIIYEIRDLSIIDNVGISKYIRREYIIV